MAEVARAVEREARRKERRGHATEPVVRGAIPQELAVDGLVGEREDRVVDVGEGERTRRDRDVGRRVRRRPEESERGRTGRDDERDVQRRRNRVSARAHAFFRRAKTYIRPAPIVRPMMRPNRPTRYVVYFIFVRIGLSNMLTEAWNAAT